MEEADFFNPGERVIHPDLGSGVVLESPHDGYRRVFFPVFLLLDKKLTEIARSVGKVDDQGNIAEDLRAQILGHLSERLNAMRWS
jgi:hypothetical protein